jgi:hypothetical protein
MQLALGSGRLPKIRIGYESECVPLLARMRCWRYNSVPQRDSNHVPGRYQGTSRHATCIICPWHPESPRQWRPKASRVHGRVRTLANRLQQPMAHADCSPTTCSSYSGMFWALPPRQLHTSASGSWTLLFSATTAAATSEQRLATVVRTDSVTTRTEEVLCYWQL